MAVSAKVGLDSRRPRGKAFGEGKMCCEGPVSILSLPCSLNLGPCLQNKKSELLYFRGNQICLAL